MRISASETSSERSEPEDVSTDAQSTFSTYREGAILALRAHDLNARLLTVRILRLVQPFSFSCVMKVEILHGLSKSDKVAQIAILKLYDRRFAAKLRTEYMVDPWTLDVEQRFVDYVNSGSAAKFMKTLHAPGRLEGTNRRWSPTENEAYLQGWCSDTLATELEAYQHLKPLQGHQIPEVFSSVTVLVRPSAADAICSARNVSPLLQVQGFLMEHIVGQSFTQMPDFVPLSHWQVLVDDALKAVFVMSSLGVLNEGVRAANIIASPTHQRNKPYRAVLLDFAQCSIRQSYQSDRDWARLKEEQDEEGVVARAMSAVLKKVGFKLKYAPLYSVNK